MIQHCKEKHAEIEHKDILNNYRMAIEAVDNKPLNRIVRKGIRIKNTIDGEIRKIQIQDPRTGVKKMIKVKLKLMNSKTEFHMPKIKSGKLVQIKDQM